MDELGLAACPLDRDSGGTVRVYRGDTEVDAPDRPGESINRDVSAWLLEYVVDPPPLEVGVCNPVAYSGFTCGGAAADWPKVGGRDLTLSTIVAPDISTLRSWPLLTRVRTEDAMGSGWGCD